MFPVYLKYKGHLTYFKIESYHQFLELKILGQYFCLTLNTAKILPDRVFIADLLEDQGKHVERITQSEFEEILKTCYQTRTETSF